MKVPETFFELREVFPGEEACVVTGLQVRETCEKQADGIG